MVAEVRRLSESVDRPVAHIEVLAATPEEQPVLANLLELYVYDFSELLGLEIGEDGRFGYPQLSLYWSEPARYPLLVRVDGKLAGFVLLKKGEAVAGRGVVWDVAEFFILRAYRRRGVGTHVAHEVWRRFPGQWEVRVMEENPSALQFWAAAVAKFRGEASSPVRVQKDGEWRQVFSFES
jgi:predicted acetyltransferase